LVMPEFSSTLLFSGGNHLKPVGVGSGI